MTFNSHGLYHWVIRLFNVLVPFLFLGCIFQEYTTPIQSTLRCHNTDQQLFCDLQHNNRSISLNTLYAGPYLRGSALRDTLAFKVTSLYPLTVDSNHTSYALQINMESTSLIWVNVLDSTLIQQVKQYDLFPNTDGLIISQIDPLLQRIDMDFLHSFEFEVILVPSIHDDIDALLSYYFTPRELRIIDSLESLTFTWDQNGLWLEN